MLTVIWSGFIFNILCRTLFVSWNSFSCFTRCNYSMDLKRFCIFFLMSVCLMFASLMWTFENLVFYILVKLMNEFILYWINYISNPSTVKLLGTQQVPISQTCQTIMSYVFYWIPTARWIHIDTVLHSTTLILQIQRLKFTIVKGASSALLIMSTTHK